MHNRRMGRPLFLRSVAHHAKLLLNNSAIARLRMKLYVVVILVPFLHIIDASPPR